MIALGSIANRTWGDAAGTHLLGALLMAVALWVQRDYPLWALPALGVGYFILRVKSPHKWWNAWAEGKWAAAFGRGLWVLPLCALISYLNASLMPLVLAIPLVLFLPAGYWIGFTIQVKTKDKIDGVAVGELINGAAIAALPWLLASKLGTASAVLFFVRHIYV